MSDINQTVATTTDHLTVSRHLIGCRLTSFWRSRQRLVSCFPFVRSLSSSEVISRSLRDKSTIRVAAVSLVKPLVAGSPVSAVTLRFKERRSSSRSASSLHSRPVSSFNSCQDKLLRRSVRIQNEARRLITSLLHYCYSSCSSMVGPNRGS